MLNTLMTTRSMNENMPIASIPAANSANIVENFACVMRLSSSWL